MIGAGYNTAGPTLMTCNSSIINSPPCNSDAALETAVCRKFPGKVQVGLADYVCNAKILRVAIINSVGSRVFHITGKIISRGKLLHLLNK